MATGAEVSIRRGVTRKGIPMKRTIFVAVIFVVAQLGLVVSASGVASASTVLSGSTNCSMTSGFVNFTEGLSATPPNGVEKADVYGVLTCTTANTLPTITSLTGIFKGVITFKKTPSPNQARSCANFTGASPVDHIASGKYVVSWTTSSGPAVHSVVKYTGTYSAVTSTTMNLNFTPSTAVVTGSYAGSLAQLDYLLPIGCPVGPGPNNETAGSLVI